MRHIRLLTAFLIIAATAVIGSIYLMLDDRQTAAAIGDTRKERASDFAGAVPLRPSFSVEKPTKLTLASDLSCDEATNAINAFTAYDQVRVALAEGADPTAVEYLECFLPLDKSDAPPEAVLKRFIGEVFEPNVLYSYLDAAFGKVLYKTVQQGNLRHGLLAWASNYLGEAALLGYARTGEKRFVALYLDYFDKLMELRDSVLDIRDDYHGKVMDSWGSANLDRNSDDADVWIAHVTHFSVIMKSATGFAKAIKTDSDLAEFMGHADRIVEFFTTAYRQFDVDLRPAQGTNEVWFWRPLVDKFEATNHLHIKGQVLLNMYAITGDEFYADRIRWIIRVFERGVAVDDDGMVAWNYHPYLQTPKAMSDKNARQHSEFVWKASLTVPFLYEAMAAGFDIDAVIIAATTKTIRDHVVADNDYKLNLNPKDSGSISERKQRRRFDAATTSITGFLSAAAADPKIADRILGIVSTRRDLFPQGWFQSDRMVRGYAYFLASRASPKPTQ